MKGYTAKYYLYEYNDEEYFSSLEARIRLYHTAEPVQKFNRKKDVFDYLGFKFNDAVSYNGIRYEIKKVLVPNRNFKA